MITLHHLNNSRSQRILWMLEELELTYDIKFYQRNKKTMLAPEKLKDVHALGKSPVITDEELVLAESGAIIEYLGQTYGNGKFVPVLGSAEYRQYLYWLHFAEGSLMPPLLISLVLDKIKTSPMPFFAKPIAVGISIKVMKDFVAPNIDNNMLFIENHLKEHKWFAGNELSGADFQMSFPLEAAFARGLVDERYPLIQAYVKRIQALPAYKQALEKGGEYAYA